MATPAETAANARVLSRQKVDGAVALSRRLAGNPSSPLGIATHEGESGGDDDIHVLGIVVGRESQVQIGNIFKRIKSQALIVQQADGEISAVPNNGGFSGTDVWVTVDQARELFLKNQKSLYDDIMRALERNRTHRRELLKPQQPR